MAENIQSKCPFCSSVTEHEHDNHCKHGEFDTDFPPFGLDGNGIPLNWGQVHRLQQEEYILEELKPGLPEYDNIVEDFSRKKIRVTRIERLQNMKLLERFKTEEEEVKKGSGNERNPNICYLYHGTTLEQEHLCENGLKQSSDKDDNRRKMLYFSKDPRNCLKYCVERNHPNETMILKCRVILDNNQGFSNDLTDYYVSKHRRAMVEYLIIIEVDNENHTSGGGWRSILTFIIFCSFGYIMTPWILKMVLWILGFTTQGVRRDSLAAKWQSFIGITRGSWFATLQSTASCGFINEFNRMLFGLFIGTILYALKSMVGMD